MVKLLEVHYGYSADVLTHRWVPVKRATIASDTPPWDQPSTWRFPPTPNRLKLHLVRRATFGGILVFLCLHYDNKNTVIYLEVRAENTRINGRSRKI